MTASNSYYGGQDGSGWVENVLPALAPRTVSVLWLHGCMTNSGGNMRRILRSLVGMALTSIAVTVVRRVSRSRGMQRKIDQLQQRFRGLDNLGDMPNNS